jgi:hypothetical protein
MFIARDLNRRLTHLILVGKNEDGELEWLGTPEDWDKGVCSDCENTGYFMTGIDDNLEEHKCHCI